MACSARGVLAPLCRPRTDVDHLYRQRWKRSIRFPPPLRRRRPLHCLSLDESNNASRLKYARRPIDLD